jgi:hypothetical protein
MASSPPRAGDRRHDPRAASAAPRPRAGRAPPPARCPSAGPRRPGGARAPPRTARPRGRSPATGPAGGRGCARGRRPGRAWRCRPSAGPRAPAAAVRPPPGPAVAQASPRTDAAASPRPGRRPSGALRAGAAPRRTAGTAAPRRPGRWNVQEDLEAGAPRAAGELRDEPSLADARLSAHERGRAAPAPGRFEGARELPELVGASDELPVRGGLHAGSIPPPKGRRKPLVGIRRQEDTSAGGGRYASAADVPTPAPRRPSGGSNRHEEAGDDHGRTANDA